MSQINTNVNSMLAQRVLGQQNQSLNQSLERLSTGLRINRGADDPAGLIASENLRSEKASIGAAIDNAERADQVVNIAEGGLQEINNLLLEMQSLVGQSANDAGLSREEKEANQLQVDSILQTIDRISSSTSFQGTKLLDGTFDYTISGQDEDIVDYQVNAAKLSHGETRDVQTTVTQSAQRGTLFMDLSGTELDLSSADDRFVFEVAGSKGSRQFTFASGTSTDDMASQINTFTEVLGVSAAVSGDGIAFKATDFGSDHFVSVDVADDGGQAGNIYHTEDDNANTADTGNGTALDSMTNAIRARGQDVGATINGMTATSHGNVVSINTDFLDVELELSEDGAQTLDTIDAFSITGGGANFNLGPDVDITNQASLGIGNFAGRNLGSASNGFLNGLGSGQDANVVDGDLSKAQKIVDDAIGQVSSARGRLGAFQKNTIGSTINSLGVALENTSAAESAIRDTDFAEETAEMTRSQILSQAAQNTLGMANNNPQNVLQLLG